jgi:hypothetical protein
MLEHGHAVKSGAPGHDPDLPNSTAQAHAANEAHAANAAHAPDAVDALRGRRRTRCSRRSQPSRRSPRSLSRPRCPLLRRSRRHPRCLRLPRFPPRPRCRRRRHCPRHRRFPPRLHCQPRRCSPPRRCSRGTGAACCFAARRLADHRAAVTAVAMRALAHPSPLAGATSPSLRCTMCDGGPVSGTPVEPAGAPREPMVRVRPCRELKGPSPSPPAMPARPALPSPSSARKRRPPE